MSSKKRLKRIRDDLERVTAERDALRRQIRMQATLLGRWVDAHEQGGIGALSKETRESIPIRYGMAIGLEIGRS